jgi:uncharacterized protein (DUF433 family)
MNTDTLVRDVDGDLFIGASRVLLQDVITARARGQTPEQIRDDFPSLTLAQIHGAIVYYLEHQAHLDDHFEQNRRALDELHAASYTAQAEFVDTMRTRFEAARAERGKKIDERAQGA